jgi:hypothetical protein
MSARIIAQQLPTVPKRPLAFHEKTQCQATAISFYEKTANPFHQFRIAPKKVETAKRY